MNVWNKYVITVKYQNDYALHLQLRNDLMKQLELKNNKIKTSIIIRMKSRLLTTVFH